MTVNDLLAILAAMSHDQRRDLKVRVRVDDGSRPHFTYPVKDSNVHGDTFQLVIEQ